MLARPHFQKLVEQVRLLPPLASAIVYPCDRESLQLAMSGAFAGYLAPVLVGPEARIRDIADKSGLDISRLPVVDTTDQPRAASIRAVELAREGSVAALIKGSLGKHDLLAPVVAVKSGLRTQTRLSHAYFLDLPGRDRGYLLADAQLNISPDLAAKRDIVLNTIGLAHALGLVEPRVALLAALDAPASAFPSTTDAIELKAMAKKGVFERAVIDGPLTPDGALSADAALAYGSASEVAGQADALIAPTMEAAIMVLRTLIAFNRSLVAGIVLGAKVPIVAPGHQDSLETRMASCVLAGLLVRPAGDNATRQSASSHGATPEPNPFVAA